MSARDHARRRETARIGIVVVGLVLGACEDPSSATKERGPAAAPAEDKGDERPPAAEAAPEEQRMVGVLVPEAEVTLVSSGFARLTRLDLAVGDHVERDAIVAEMELRGEQTDLESATAAWRAAKAELDRLELELAKARDNRADVELLKGIVSEAELREQRYAEELAGARKRSAGAELRQQRSKMQDASNRIAEADLRTPFSGVVAQRFVDVGATLATGEPVVELISDARLLRFAVPEVLGDRLHLGATIQAEFGETDVAISGEIVSIAPEIDAGTRLVFAEARLAPALTDELRVGAVARVRFSPAAAGR